MITTPAPVTLRTPLGTRTVERKSYLPQRLSFSFPLTHAPSCLARVFWVRFLEVGACLPIGEGLDVWVSLSC